MCKYKVGKESTWYYFKEKTYFKLWQKTREGEDWLSLCRAEKTSMCKANYEEYDTFFEWLRTS